jgi:hypothetical protein
MSHYWFFSSFQTNHQIFNKRNTRWAICRICVPIQFTIFTPRFYFFYFFFNNCPSYIYKLWLPLWYLQTLIDTNMAEHCIKNLEPRQNIDVTLLILFHLSRLPTRFLTSVILGGLLVGSVYPFRSLYLTPRFYFYIFIFVAVFLLLNLQFSL